MTKTNTPINIRKIYEDDGRKKVAKKLDEQLFATIVPNTLNKQIINCSNCNRKYTNIKPSKSWLCPICKPSKPHKHDFQPAIAFDYQDNSYEYGLCKCGEKDM